MALFKCKMCGGALEVTEGLTICECLYCGTEQTLPKLNNDKKQNLYDRADHFRRNNDFDKAMSIYEQILNEDTTDAEAYWSLVLCKYGIEYVDDPVTHKKVPTVNRAQYTSIYADENFKAAIQHSDFMQKNIYEAEAKVIDNIQKGILEISSKEAPFDVFICYKETDSNGRRTQDSVLANDLYHQLTQEGFNVFFSRITLEDKLGSAYEPYIFAALNSAKVMVVLGTKPEYFNAVWVKNEWSRYLALIKAGEKKILIPAYRDMDPYDLPEEFSHLQAQDMTKLGFMQDLIRGIKKIAVVDKPQEVTKETVVVQQGGGQSNISALIKRGNMALEDGEWQKADDFFEEVLNKDAECAEAYLGKFLAKFKQCDTQSLVDYIISKYENSSYEKLEACQEENTRIEDAIVKYVVTDYFSENEIKREYSFDRTYLSDFSSRQEQKNQGMSELLNEKLFIRAQQYASGQVKQSIDEMVEMISASFDGRIVKSQEEDNNSIDNIVKSYKVYLEDADARVQELHKKAIEKREEDYNAIVSRMNSATSVSEYLGLKREFIGMNGYKDTIELAEKCDSEIFRIKEAERIEKERLEEEERLDKERELEARREAYYNDLIIKKAELDQRTDFEKITELKSLIKEFTSINSYKDSSYMVTKCKDEIEAIEKEIEFENQRAEQIKKEILKKKKRITLLSILTVLVIVSVIMVVRYYIIPEFDYKEANNLLNQGEYDEAYKCFLDLDNYKESSELSNECMYQKALSLVDIGNYDEAILLMEQISLYSDAQQKIMEIDNLKKEEVYKSGISLLKEAQYSDAKNIFVTIAGYKDVDAQIEMCEEGENRELYENAVSLMENEKYEDAVRILECIPDYKDASEIIKFGAYETGQYYYENSDFEKAIKYYEISSDYEDSEAIKNKIVIEYSGMLVGEEQYEKAINYLGSISDNADKKEIYNAAIYGYVTDNYKYSNLDTFEYLKALSEENYKDAKDLYNKLYGWRVTKYDIELYEDIAIKYIERGWNSPDGFYSGGKHVFGFKVEGGGPDQKESFTVKYITQYTGQQKESVSSSVGSGEITVVDIYLDENRPYSGEYGVAAAKYDVIVSIYDSMGNKIWEENLWKKGVHH